jgi:hypothetical protein
VTGRDRQQMLNPCQIEPVERDSLGAIGSPEVGEDVRQRVRAIEVGVAVCADVHDRPGVVAPKEVAQQLKRRPEILLATFTIEHPAEINNLIAYNPEIITPAVDIERSSVGKFLSRTYRNLILNEEAATDLPIKGYEIAEGGINGLNKLFGWEMALQKTNDENGDLQSLYFSSKMLKFNAPVKKSETTP